MTAALVLLLAALGWAGTATLLSELGWFRRPPLRRRLAAHVDAHVDAGGPLPGAATSSLAAVLLDGWHDRRRQLAEVVGARLEVRLHRAGSDLTPTEFRRRQLTEASVALVAAATLAVGAALPPPAAAVVVVVPPALVLLVREQRLHAAERAWVDRLDAELPVVAEQLAMLLGSGYSLGGAVDRLARRGEGICAEGFAAAIARVRQGLSDHEALDEWATGTGRPAAERLVRVLRLNAEATDLGDLIAAEARSARREAQRTLEATIERRGQLVWVPVTVATLLPGVIFMAVPFIDAMNQLTG